MPRETEKIMKDLSTTLRKVYGIRDKERVSTRTHKQFVNDVIRDLTNISFNLAVADHVAMPSEKEFFLKTLTVIFYPGGEAKPNPDSTLGRKFDNYETEAPEVKSPLLTLLRAKAFDEQRKTDFAGDLKKLFMEYGEAMVMIDGFESISEFGVLETFRMWVEEA